MSFQPVLPLSGYAGWSFLKRTQGKQQAAQQASPVAQREAEYFRKTIGKIQTAKDLVADRRLLSVALTAFGLEQDINYKAFLQKVLQDGTLSDDALANKLSDKRYLAFSKAFGFGDFETPRSQMSDFADKILGLYNRQSFESAVGEQNNTFRLALNAEHALTDLAKGGGSENAKWFSILGNEPLRRVMQGALGLPDSFALIDIDKQLATLKSRARTVLGVESVSQFAEPAVMEKLVRTYIVRAEMGGNARPSSAASIALQILGR